MTEESVLPSSVNITIDIFHEKEYYMYDDALPSCDVATYLKYIVHG